MKTLGVFLLLVACVSSGLAHKDKEYKKKDPTIKAIWLSHNRKTSYFKLDDGTYIEYFTSEKEKFNRYKALVETKSGFTILKPLFGNLEFYLAISHSKVLYQEKTFKNIEKHGHVESSGYWIKLETSYPKSKSKSKHSKSKHHSKSDSKSHESKKCEHCDEDPCKNKCTTNKNAKCVNICDTCEFKFTYKKKDVVCPVADNNEQERWIQEGGRRVYERVSSKEWRLLVDGSLSGTFQRISSTKDKDGFLVLYLQGASSVVALSAGSVSTGPLTTSLTVSGVGYWADEKSNILPRPKEESHAQVKWTTSDNTIEFIKITSDIWIRNINNAFTKYTKVSTKRDKNGYQEVVLLLDGSNTYIRLTQGKYFSGSTPSTVTTEVGSGYWENKFGNPVSRPNDGSHNIVRWVAADDTFEFVKISHDRWTKYVDGKFYAEYKRHKYKKDKNGYPILDLKEVNNEDYVRLSEGTALQGDHPSNIKTELGHGFWADKSGNFVTHPPSNSKSKSKSHHSKSKSHHYKSKSHHYKSKSKSYHSKSKSDHY